MFKWIAKIFKKEETGKYFCSGKKDCNCKNKKCEYYLHEKSIHFCDQYTSFFNCKSEEERISEKQKIRFTTQHLNTGNNDSDNETNKSKTEDEFFKSCTISIASSFEAGNTLGGNSSGALLGELTNE